MDNTAVNTTSATRGNNNNNVIEIDLLEVLGVLLQNIWLIISIGIFTALVGFIIARFMIAPYYDSTTKIYILNKTDNSSVTYSDVQIGTQLTKDYAELISSRYVLEEVISKLSLDMEYKELLEKIAVSTPTDTRIVSITVTDDDPVAAMNIANCVREVASDHIQNVMDIEAVNVVETANMPTRKAGPSGAKWTLISGLLGALAVSAFFLIRYLMDDTIKSSDDVEKYLGLGTLALIPMVEEQDKGSNLRRKSRKKKSTRKRK